MNTGTLVATVFGAGGVLSVIFTTATARKVERIRAVAAANANDNETQRITLELVKTLQSEVDRKDRQLVAVEAQNEILRAQLANKPPPRRKPT